MRSHLLPDLAAMTRQERLYWLGDAAGLAYAAPLAILGVGWLTSRTRLSLAREHWAALLLTAALVALFRQLQFYRFAEIKTGLYADWGGSFDSVAAWAGALVLGPVAFWPGLLYSLVALLLSWGEASRANLRLPRLRRFALAVADDSLLPVIALDLYRRWGGGFPLAGITPGAPWPAFWPAVFAALVWYLLSSLLYLPYYALTFVPPSAGLPADERRQAIRAVAWLYLVTGLLPALLSPYAALSAGMAAGYGFWMYALALSGLILPAFLASWLSEAAERSYHRSRELERLDRLSAAIIDAPTDASTLPELLQEHVPGMFPDSQVEVRLFAKAGGETDRVLLRSSADYPPVAEAVWDWLRAWASPEPRYFLAGAARPWSRRSDGSAYVIAPIWSLSSGEMIGGVCVVVRWWPNKIVPYFLPAVQSLAALVSSALHQAETTAQMLAHARLARELALAGEIQAGLLPRNLPQPPGWQIAAALEPCRETAGDFYDLIPLPGGRLGIVIADVADKGLGAALYMALARTLIRTYALAHPTRPDLALRAANRRLLADSQADMFVTAFYGVLDPRTGRLDYCNAGHVPPRLVRPLPAGAAPPGEPAGRAAQELRNTGMALGVLAEAPLGRASTTIEPGAALLLFTDGIPEARNPQGEFFAVDRLVEIARGCLGAPAADLRDALLAAVRRFAGEAPPADDVTLVVIAREAPG